MIRLSNINKLLTIKQILVDSKHPNNPRPPSFTPLNFEPKNFQLVAFLYTQPVSCVQLKRKKSSHEILKFP